LRKPHISLPGRRFPLSRWLRCSLYAALIGLLTPLVLGQASAERSQPQPPAAPAANAAPGVPLKPQTPEVTLDTSETLFAVLAGINACGYDQDLNASDPLRLQIRKEITKAVNESVGARDVLQGMCQIYNDHQQPDGPKNLSQYVSLALFLNPPPAFTVKVKEKDLPPDAAALVSFLPALAKFYEVAHLHSIWSEHRAAYEALTQRYHEPLSKMLFDTELYLKLPSAGYLGHQFTVYLDLLGAPAQTNARNYGPDYFVVLTPGPNTSLKMQQIRHTYLHYLLDPMSLKYPEVNKKLEPLLESVKTAPMDEGFKTDVSLLYTECLIRAIEIRMEASGAQAEENRQAAVQAAVKQGFVLTRFFYDSLAQFEKDPAGFRNVYGQMLAGIDVGKEEKRAGQVDFAAKADPELLHLARAAEGKLLINAEQKLSAGDPASAQKLAQQALDEKTGDQGRALFILAQVATTNRDIEGARTYFQRALTATSEPKVVAWSHIYLGRIFDLQEERDAALDHYRAALNAAASLPEAKAAAEKGLQQPYEPPRDPKQ